MKRLFFLQIKQKWRCLAWSRQSPGSSRCDIWSTRPLSTTWSSECITGSRRPFCFFAASSLLPITW